MPDTLDRSRIPLLTLLTDDALDRDYQSAASRRDDDDPRGWGSRTAVLVVVAAFALLVTVAAVQTSRNADVDDASRAGLIDRIDALRGQVGELQQQIAELRSANAAADESLRALGSSYADSQAKAADLGALTGFDRVAGDGVRVRLDDPPYAGPKDGVRDSDLALLVNALWDAGAEAVSVNGQRLSVRSEIRTSGEAIKVNGVGIAPPYTVLAVGNQRTLAAKFVESSSGLQFLAVVDQFGFDYDLDNADDLHLPATPAALERLRSATMLDKRGKPEEGGTR